jgi:hypothetical protein
MDHMGNKRKKGFRDDRQPPPKSAQQQSAEEELRQFRATWRQPPLPQRRLILAFSGMAVGTLVAFLIFLLPAQSLVQDLRSRGVTTVAEVTASPKNKYGEAGNVEVRFSGPEGKVQTVLADWGGKRPEGLLSGAQVSVTYDPREPTRVLTTEWVEDPPAMTLPMLITLTLTPVFLLGAILLLIRRRKLLKAREHTATA